MGAISIAPSPRSCFRRLAAEPLGKGVVERAKIGRELVLEIAGQEAQPLAGLDRGPGEDDAADAAGFQCLDRGGDGEIGLAGAGRPQRQDQIVAADRRHERALRFAARANRADIALFALGLALRAMLPRSPEQRLDIGLGAALAFGHGSSFSL